jgi:parallel beta-helix repeat protein
MAAPAAPTSSTGTPAAAYYVDASAGNDRNDGRSPATAWQSIAKVNASSFVAGDQVLFKRGEVWREQLRNSSGGVAGKPITYGAYGSGQKPSIRGSDRYDNEGGWRGEGNTLWYVPGIQADPGVFAHDGVLAVRRVAKAGLSAQWDYWYDSDNSRFYVYSTANPAAAASSLEIAVRDSFVTTQSWSYVTYDNLDIRHFRGAHTWLGWGANGITFQNDDFSQLANYGLQFHNGSANGIVSHCTFTDWGVVDGQDYAVHVIGRDANQTTGPVDVTDSTFTVNHSLNNTELAAVLGDIYGWVRNVQRNTAVNNGKWPGTAFWTWRPGKGARSINFESNSTYRTGSSGIELQELNYNGATPDTKVRYNYIADADQLDVADTEALRVWGFNSSTSVEASYNIVNRTREGAHSHPGIYLYNATGTKLYGNTIYGADDGILVKAASLKNDIRNNISVFGRGHGITVQDSSTVASFGNNLFYGNAAGNYNGIGAGAGDVLSDPKFASSNPASPASFQLQPDSPAINTGAALESTQSNALRPGSNWPNNIVTIDQNLRGAWGIGAFEYVGP